MTTTYTASLRFTLPSVNDPAVANIWGSLLNADMPLIESAITGVVSISLASLTTITLSANNGAADQSRPYGLQFTGSPTGGACTVIIPGLVKFGLIKNASSGTVTLTTGGGLSAYLPPGGLNWTMYYCDGVNVSLIQKIFTGLQTFTLAAQGNFTVPSGITQVKARVWAGGGAGGDGGGAGYGAGGAGGGGYGEQWNATASGTSILCTVGAGGVGNGNGGASSSFGSLVVASGGLPGGAGTAGGGGGAGGAGGSVPGQYGCTGQAGSGNAAGMQIGGAGGASFCSAGAPAVFAAAGTVNGIAGTLPGAGGGGAIGTGTGGVGAPGQIIVEW